MGYVDFKQSFLKRLRYEWRATLKQKINYFKMFGRIVLGLVIMGVGLLMSLKSNAFLNFFGPMGWAEKIFSHGSNTGYKVLGIILFFVGLFIATNLMNSILMGIFGGMIGTN